MYSSLKEKSEPGYRLLPDQDSSSRRFLTRFLCALAIAVLCLTELHAQTKLGAQYDNAGCGQAFAVDKDGVTVVTYPDLGTQYNPVTIAQTALGCYHNYKRSGSEQARRKYLEQIHWLRENYLRVSDDMAAYAYQFAWAGYGLASGWHSGLAQGQAISALIRYYYDTGDKSVLPLINELKNFLFLPQEKGGVLRTTPEGGIWFEEYPSDPPSFVWNGNVSTILKPIWHPLTTNAQAIGLSSATISPGKRSASSTFRQPRTLARTE
jgi:hypothetical protein